MNLELPAPPHHLGGAADIHRRVQHHFPPPHIRREFPGVVGHLGPAKPSWKPKQLAGAGRLAAGPDGGRTDERAGVEDGHGRVGVLDGDDVGVGDVDGEDHLGVEGGEVELEGGEVDGDEVESGVARPRRDDECSGGGGCRPDGGGAPAEPPLFGHEEIGRLRIGGFKDKVCGWFWYFSGDQFEFYPCIYIYNYIYIQCVLTLNNQFNIFD